MRDVVCRRRGRRVCMLAAGVAAAWPLAAMGANDPYQTLTDYKGYTTTFTNPSTVWYGSNVALILDNTNASQAAAYNQSTMTKIVTALGNMFTTYESVTGFTNISIPAPVDGLIPIEASNNIGGGLASSNGLGIGVGEGFFTGLYGRVNSGTNTYDQVFFYEAQRNFWVPQLMQKIDAATSTSPSSWGWWTVAFNNAMAALLPPSVPGITDMYYYGENGAQFSAGMVANLTTYLSSSQYTWANSWDVDRVPWNTSVSVNDLMTGLLITLSKSYGGVSFMSGLYHQIPNVPDLASAHADTQGEQNNFYIAASRAAGVDLRSYFTTTLKWTISPTADPNYQQWNGNTNGLWGTASNWTGLAGTATVAPTGSSVNVAFNGSSNSAVDLHGNQTVGSLRFDGQTSGSFTLSNSVAGASLTLASGGTISKDITTVDGTETLATPITLAGNATFSNNNTSDSNQNALMFTGGITGNSVVHITGRAWDDGTENNAGVELATNNPNLSGNIWVDSGWLIVGSNTALGTGTTVLDGGTVWFAAATTVPENFEVATNSTQGNFGGNTLAGNVAIDSGATWNVTNGGGNTFNLTGAISGPGNLNMSSGGAVMGGAVSNTLTGTVTLSAASGYLPFDTVYLSKTGGAVAIAGPLLVQNDGIVVLQGNNEIGSASVVTLDGNSTHLQLLGHSDTIAGLQSGVDGAGIVENESGAVNTGTLAISPASGSSYTFAGTLRNGDGVGTNGTLALTISGPGTQVLSGANSYTGATTVTAGILSAGSTTAFGVNSAVTLASGAQLQLNGYSVAIGSLTGSGNVGLGTGTLTVGADNTSPAAYSGAMSGTSAAAGLIKVGSGKLILGGINTYAGTTTIQGGTLVANTAGTGTPGTGNSATGTGGVTIATGAVLAGGTTAAPGRISGSVAVSSGAEITAGSGATTSDTVGQLYTGSETWNSGGTYVVKIGSGNVSDELIMSGLTPSASTTSPFTVQVIGLSASSLYKHQSIAIAEVSGGNATTFSASVLATLKLTTTGNAPAASYFSLAEAPDTVVGGNGGEDLLLVDIAAPEPTSLLLLGAVISPLMLHRRARNRCTC